MTYDRVTIWLHWLTAVLVAVLWGLAQIIDFWPSGSDGRIAVRSLHVLLGLLLVAVLVTRLVWRQSQGRQLPPAETGLLGLGARLTHWALYALLVVALIAGIANTWVRGDSFFGLFRLVSFAPGDRAMRQLVGSLHEVPTNLILILAGLHAAAALFHHFIKRDGVLRRMLPG
jgi:cytochrome b561